MTYYTQAKLRAAAPELLEALKFAAAGFAIIAKDRTATEHTREFSLNNFNQARAAIAKAEGKP